MEDNTRQLDMKRKGFTLVEIMIVVLIISILLSIAVPGFINARETSQGTACDKTRRGLDDAKVAWAIETGAASKDVPTMADLVPVYLKQIPSCPTSGTYTLGDTDTPVTCSVH